MNVEKLRSALHEPAPVPLTVDVERVLARGRRRRAARRAAVPLVAAATAAAIAVPALVLSDRTVEVETAVPPTATPTAVATATAAPTVSGPAASGPAGPVVDTGDRLEGGTRAFALRELASGRYALQMAVRGPAGGLDPRHSAYPPLTAATPAGFRAVSFAGATAGDWVFFGAYVGPAARVTAVLDGRPATARIGRLAGLPGMTVFWFSAGTGAPEPADATEIGDLRAYDAAGNRLPAGNTGIGQG